jgi:hypothetical protein
LHRREESQNGAVPVPSWFFVGKVSVIKELPGFASRRMEVHRAAGVVTDATGEKAGEAILLAGIAGLTDGWAT